MACHAIHRQRQPAESGRSSSLKMMGNTNQAQGIIKRSRTNRLHQCRVVHARPTGCASQRGIPGGTRSHGRLCSVCIQQAHKLLSLRLPERISTIRRAFIITGFFSRGTVTFSSYMRGTCSNCVDTRVEYREISQMVIGFRAPTDDCVGTGTGACMRMIYQPVQC